MRSALGGARVAWLMLTRLPWPGSMPSGEAERWAPAYFPLVGAVIGAAMAGVFAAFAHVGSLAAASLAFGAGLLLTGAYHEDGLADTADALGSGARGERLFSIFKDSRVGSFGAVAIATSLVLRVVLLASAGPFGAPWVILATQTAARVPPVLLMRLLPYVTPPESTKNTGLGAPTPLVVGVAFSWPLVLFIGLFMAGRLPLADIAAAWIGLLVLIGLSALWLRRRLGGYTGDTLGALEQVSEIHLLLSLVGGWTP